MISYPALSHARSLEFQGSYWSLKSSVGEENVDEHCILWMNYKIVTVFAEQKRKWQITADLRCSFTLGLN